MTPGLTEAQYKWTLNGYNIIQAKEFYFDGNYMRDVSKNASHTISGWNGKENIVMDAMELRNFSNALLANKEGEDLYYTMNWSIETYDKDNVKQEGSKRCSISCTATSADEGKLSYTQGNVLSGQSKSSIMGTGDPKKDVYTFTIVKGTQNLEPDDYVIIRFSAENRSKSAAENNTTSNDYTYHRKLSVVYRYVVTSSDTFIQAFDPEENVGSRTLGLYIGAGNLPDMTGAAQSIIVWWDTDTLQINPFNQTFKDANSVQGNYQTITANGRSFAQLKLAGLQSGAERTPAFFKQSGNRFGLEKTAIWFPDEGAQVAIARNIKPNDAENNQILGFYVLSNLTSDD